MLEFLHIIIRLGLEDFDGGLRVEAEVFSQIHFCKSTKTQQTHEAIIAKLLAHTVWRLLTSLWEISDISHVVINVIVAI